MNKLLSILLILVFAAVAQAQPCYKIGNNTVCGNTSGSIEFQMSSSGSALFSSNGTAIGSVNSSGFAPATTNVVDLGTVTKVFKKTYGGGYSFGAAVETVAAAGSVQGNGALGQGKYVHLVTGFDETKVVTLTACDTSTIGDAHFLLNNTTDKFAKIFPNTGDQINSLGANNAYTQGVTGQGGKVLMCVCQAAGQWYCG